LLPDLRAAALANRAFLGRAVRYAVRQGIRQFVDIGSGLPTAGQVHEIADQNVSCRVCYVDNDPIVHAHATLLLEKHGDPFRHSVVYGDYLDYEALWVRVFDSTILNPDEPTCLLVVSLLHFFTPEQNPYRPMDFYRAQLAPGSLLVLTHGSDDLDDPAAREVAANYSATTSSAHLRSRDEILLFFGDFGLVEPGLVWVPQWRPDPDSHDIWDGNPARSRYWAGIARKPGNTARRTFNG
ncbi:MAG: SAM-dependent methyltransferase, partial [Pseudonocardiales bacterium]|nr:SAM-dependent methyltransferase [Pseudonocardiales bacterium]